MRNAFSKIVLTVAVLLSSVVVASAQAPSITTQPSPQNVAAGSAAGFSVGASGSSLTYQWFHDGAALSGKTASSLSLTNVQAVDAGNYSVAVTNPGGTATSNAAALTLTSAPVFTGVSSSSGLIVEKGTTATLTASVTGSPTPTLQWSKNGSALGGASAATLTLSNVQPGDAGVYTVAATNTYGTVTSGSIELTVAQIGSGTGPISISTSLGTQVNGTVDATTGELTGGVTAGGPSATVAPKVTGLTAKSGLMIDQGSSATLTVAATGSPAPTYQWYKDGSILAGQTGASLSLSNAQPSDAASYTVTATNASGSVTSQAVKVTVASISGSGALAITGGDGTQISGNYNTTTGALSGSVTSGGANAAVAPKIADIVNHSNLLLEMGQAATLTVTASGSPAPTYQWYKNGSALAGATSANYAIASVAAGDAGQYSVTATNSGGTVTSQTIDVSVTSLTAGSGSLTIATSGGTQITGTVDSSGALNGAVTTAGTTVAPAIASLSSRGGAFVNQGATLSLSVAASGNPLPAFQWYKDDAALSGQTASALVIANAQPGDAGSYTVKATNASGSVTSDAVAVTVSSISSSGALEIAGGDGTHINGNYDTTSGALSGGVTTGWPAAAAPKLSSVAAKSDLLLELGKAATLSVSATGNPAPTFQWYKNDTAISGATSSSYTIATAAVTDAGVYTVRATNSAGSATTAAVNVSVTSLTSGGGTLTIATSGGTQINGNVDPSTGAVTGGVATNTTPGVTAAPRIASLSSQGGLFLNQGGSAVLTSTATGNPTPTFQWLKNGAALSGQTSSSLSLTNVQASDAGSYAVRVTNSAGTATSDAVPVTIASIGTNGQIAIAGGNGTQISANYNSSTGGLSGSTTSTGSLGAVAAKISSLTSDPGSLLVDRGAPATLTVTATGNPPPSYQWYKGGVALSGQTTPSLSFASVQDSDAGNYTVKVTNASGSVTSANFGLSVVALGTDGSVAVNTATGTQVSAALDTQTGALLGTVAPSSSNGTVAPKIAAVDTTPSALLLHAGTAATLSVLANGTPAPSYQWFKDGSALPGRTFADLALTNIQGSDAGTYVVRVTNSQGTTLSGPIVVSVVNIGSDGAVSLSTGGGTSLGGMVDSSGNANGSGTSNPTNPGTPGDTFSKLTNFSSLGTAGAGANTVVTGFVIGGTGSRQLLVRAVGPGLGAFGINGTLNTPVLTLAQGAQTLVTNSSWTAAPNPVEITQAGDRSGAFPLNSDGRDAAVLATLGTGAYTANVSSSGSSTGQALVELYDANGAQAGGARIVNFSSLQKVGSDATLAAGFYVSGNTSKKVLIRAVGPTLQQSFGVAGALSAPVLRVYQGDTLLASNRDYRTSGDAAAIVSSGASAGAFALGANAADSAVILILSPGSYSVRINDANGATGTAMVEIYELP